MYINFPFIMSGTDSDGDSSCGCGGCGCILVILIVIAVIPAFGIFSEAAQTILGGIRDVISIIIGG